MEKAVWPQEWYNWETYGWCLGLNSFLWRSAVCNEVPLHTVGPCFTVISGAHMNIRKFWCRRLMRNKLSHCSGLIKYGKRGSGTICGRGGRKGWGLLVVEKKVGPFVATLLSPVRSLAAGDPYTAWQLTWWNSKVGVCASQW